MFNNGFSMSSLKHITDKSQFKILFVEVRRHNSET